MTPETIAQGICLAIMYLSFGIAAFFLLIVSPLTLLYWMWEDKRAERHAELQAIQSKCQQGPILECGENLISEFAKRDYEPTAPISTACSPVIPRGAHALAQIHRT
jgi:hypothetical protein